MSNQTWRTDIVLIVFLILCAIARFVEPLGSWFNIVLAVAVAASIGWLGWLIWRRQGGRWGIVDAAITLLLVGFFVVVHVRLQSEPAIFRGSQYMTWFLAEAAYLVIRSTVVALAAVTKKHER